MKMRQGDAACRRGARRSGVVADRRAARESCRATQGDDEKAKAAFRQEPHCCSDGAVRADAKAAGRGARRAATAATRQRRPRAGAAPARDRPVVRGQQKHGFLQSEGRDIFVHLSDVKEPLNEGDIVEFSVLDFKDARKRKMLLKSAGLLLPPRSNACEARLWYDATRKMGFLKAEDGQEVSSATRPTSKTIGEGDCCRGDGGSRRIRAFSWQEQGRRRHVCGTGAAAAAAAAAADHRQHHRPTLGRRGAGVFLSIVSDVAGAGWIEDQQLGAALTGKGVRLALIHAMRAGALKRRWVEYGRRRPT